MIDNYKASELTDKLSVAFGNEKKRRFQYQNIMNPHRPIM